MTKSKKTSKPRQQFDFGMEQKITTLLCILFVAGAFWSEDEDFLRRGPPLPILPRPCSATGRIWPINNSTCKGP